jgi:carbon storage regulator CsrA
MLVLTLKEDEQILIGDKITVKVVEIRGNQIRLGVEAPASVLVLREKQRHKGWISFSYGRFLAGLISIGS